MPVTGIDNFDTHRVEIAKADMCTVYHPAMLGANACMAETVEDRNHLVASTPKASKRATAFRSTLLPATASRLYSKSLYKTDVTTTVHFALLHDIRHSYL
ncbi:MULTISPECIES: hypothetical protein [Acidithrix]|uniref:hypothetical protein n=1 Tax=Acidithrix TaxID=1609233 RepID=UPI0006962982|nr:MULTISPECIES: hypothetical protein [Acidithrix]